MQSPCKVYAKSLHLLPAVEPLVPYVIRDVRQLRWERPPPPRALPSHAVDGPCPPPAKVGPVRASRPRADARPDVHAARGAGPDVDSNSTREHVHGATEVLQHDRISSEMQVGNCDLGEDTLPIWSGGQQNLRCYIYWLEQQLCVTGNLTRNWSDRFLSMLVGQPVQVPTEQRNMAFHFVVSRTDTRSGA